MNRQPGNALARWLKASALLLLVPLAQLAVAQPQKQLRLACSIEPGNPVYGVFHDLYRDALAPLGFEVVLVYRPDRRGLADTATGQLDGDCARTPEVEEGPDDALVRVPRAIGRFTLYGWSYDQALHQLPAQALLEGPYQLAYVRGNLVAEQLMAKRAHGTSQGVLNPAQGFKMLAAGRIDALITVRELIDAAQQQTQTERELYATAPLSQFTAYLYLHSKHRHLVQPVSENMAQILSDPRHPMYQIADEQ